MSDLVINPQNQHNCAVYQNTCEDVIIIETRTFTLMTITTIISIFCNVMILVIVGKEKRPQSPLVMMSSTMLLFMSLFSWVILPKEDLADSFFNVFLYLIWCSTMILLTLTVSGIINLNDVFKKFIDLDQFGFPRGIGGDQDQADREEESIIKISSSSKKKNRSRRSNKNEDNNDDDDDDQADDRSSSSTSKRKGRESAGDGDED